MSAIALMPDDPVQPPTMLIETRQSLELVTTALGRATSHIRAGVKAVLLLDTEQRRVCVVRYDELPYTVGVGSTVTLHGIRPDFAVPVAKFFE
jgi:hypothetical protein